MKLSYAPEGVGKMQTKGKFGVGKMAGGEEEDKKAGMKAHEGLEKLMAHKGKK